LFCGFQHCLRQRSIVHRAFLRAQHTSSHRFAKRGLHFARFLGAPEDGLNDPRLLPDADRVVDRIRQASRAGERVMVFGDFDADGLTGLAQLVLAFRRLGLDTIPYVPSRVDEGHGLSTAAVDAAVRDRVAPVQLPRPVEEIGSTLSGLTDRSEAARYLDDVSVERIAGLEQCSTTAIRSRLARARQAFREKFMRLTDGAIDEMLGARGYYKGSSILISGASGSGKILTRSR
jgi:DNA-directed RNA polymerase specialized sigma24 family protein